jgi:hypothetical protein
VNAKGGVSAQQALVLLARGSGAYVHFKTLLVASKINDTEIF